ncbi:helix-turn-helix domain-containing protein [Nonomuraea sp. NPDC049725]|uniref:TetR/AcrR family transcriptional regulator n=1 Tax=Nonomuraea sp. NPDC049725 TaxID=3154508 RepID=UPI003428B05B
MNRPAPRRRPGRPAKADAGDTKAELLRAALTLFARHGYAGTSVRAIAREVGLSESVLYAHFPGKQAIFEAALALGGPHITVAAIAGLDATPAGSPAAYVRDLAAAVLDAWDTPEGRRLASLAARDGLMHDPALADAIDASLEHLAGVFRRWLDDGLIRDDLGDADDLAYALLSPIAHARVLWLHDDATPAQRDKARERALRHADLFARAVTPPAARG